MHLSDLSFDYCLPAAASLGHAAIPNSELPQNSLGTRGEIHLTRFQTYRCLEFSLQFLKIDNP